MADKPAKPKPKRTPEKERELLEKVLRANEALAEPGEELKPGQTHRTEPDGITIKRVRTSLY